MALVWQNLCVIVKLNCIVISVHICTYENILILIFNYFKYFNKYYKYYIKYVRLLLNLKFVFKFGVANEKR